MPLYRGINAAVGRTRVRRESPFWREPLPNPEQGVLLAFPRRPYWIRTTGPPLAITPHGMRVIPSGRDEPCASAERGFDVENIWIHVTSERLAADLRGARASVDGIDVAATLRREVALGAETHIRLRALVAHLESGVPCDPRTVEAFISEILASVLAAGDPDAPVAPPRNDATGNGHAAAVHRAKMFMAENLVEPLTVGDVARAAGLSRSHLCRVFRERTSLSVHAFLNELRLREAVWRLPDYRHRIGELGVELGYNSASHFTTAFRSRFGTPPRSLAARLEPGYIASSRRAASWRTSE
ncbi:AraC family transcriptional regulator [bacterium]|nr:AraC family transcriptional regulator [bacterium]